NEVCEVPAPRADTAPSKRWQPTDERITCIVECAIAHNYISLVAAQAWKEEGHAASRDVADDVEAGALEACDAQHGDDIRLAREVREQAQGKAEIGANNTPRTTQAQKTKRTRMCGLQGAMSMALDEFILLEQECLGDDEAVKASSAAREQLG
ncbi:MAG: hypothetical protein SGPRY_007015, partial [Prymnesium sp.]